MTCPNSDTLLCYSNDPFLSVWVNNDMLASYSNSNKISRTYSAVIIVHAAISNSICMHICSYKLLRYRDKVDV